MATKRNSLLKNKKGQIISGLVGGIAGLIILVIISLLIVETLNSAGLIDKLSVADSTQNAATFIDTGLTLTTCAAQTDGVITTIVIINETAAGTLDAANYTTAGCIVTAASGSSFNNTGVNITYSFDYDTQQQEGIDNMVVNYTAGIDNVSEKLPTVLLIAAVVLLFGAIVFLVQRSRTITSVGGGV